MVNLQKIIPIASILCLATIFAQENTPKSLKNDNAGEYKEGTIKETQPANLQAHTSTIRASKETTIVAFDDKNYTSFENPRIVSKNDRGITIRIKGAQTTPEGKQEFTSIIKTSFNARHSPGKLRGGELTITSSLSDETYINRIRIYPFTLGLPFHVSYTSATGMSCDFIKENSKSWAIKSSEGSLWTITPTDPSNGITNYLASNGTTTKKISIVGDGDQAVFYITSSNGESYAIPATAFGL